MIQSNYVPWIGYFAVMASVDLFIVYECVQYTKNDWRNRNQIQSPDGRRTWLTIPIRHYNFKQAFMETTVSRHDWALSHFKTLHHHFARSKGWLRWRDELEFLYMSAEKMTHLYKINRLFLDWTVATLRLNTPLAYLDFYQEYQDPNDRLISILGHYEATHYVSGPTAQKYIDPKKFEDAKIELNYVNYEKIINEALVGSHEIKTTSILQLILEGNHEFRCH